MHNRGRQLSIIAGLIFLLFADAASADDLRGYFPLYNGRFWNFTGSPDSATVTWAVNGSLTLKDVGRVTLMALDNGRFLCLREDWEGIRIYGDYSADQYLVPEKPLLFLPGTLKPGEPVEVDVTLKVFSDPEGNINFKETGKINQKIKFLHKEYEDITISGQVFKNCAVIEKITTRAEHRYHGDALSGSRHRPGKTGSQKGAGNQYLVTQFLVQQRNGKN